MVSRSPVFLSEFGRVSVPNLFGAERVQILTQKTGEYTTDTAKKGEVSQFMAVMPKKIKTGD